MWLVSKIGNTVVVCTYNDGSILNNLSIKMLVISDGLNVFQQQKYQGSEIKVFAILNSPGNVSFKLINILLLNVQKY